MIERDDIFKIIRQKEVFRETGTKFVVVDEDLRVLYLNELPVDEAEKMCPGDLLKCTNAIACTDGCGHHENCVHCILRNTVSRSIASNKQMSGDENLLLADNEEFDLHAVSTPFEHEGKKYAIVLLEDRTTANRELMMERIFFHDVINLSGALNGILECIQNDKENRDEMIGIVKDISDQLMNELNSQKDLIYAQKGILECDNKPMAAKDVVLYTYESLLPVVNEHHHNMLLLDSTLKDEQIKSDKTLIHRVLHNMIKNACEASESGESIILRARSSEQHVTFSVHNGSVMPSNIKSHMFRHGNTTKGKGHGLGTYSIKLIGENYLKGHVWFTSADGQGTDFYLQLDRSDI